MVGFESKSWELLFFYWFEGNKLVVDDQNFKRRGDARKREYQISRGRLVFLFNQSKLMSHFGFCYCYSCFARYCAKKEMPRIQLMTALLL